MLVPFDGSSLAARAFPFAVKLAGVSHGRLLVVQAVPESRFVPLAERELAPVVDQLCRHCRRRGLDVAVSSMVRCGDPARTIQHIAAAERASVVVMTTHGQHEPPERGGPGRWLYGGVASATLRRAAAPVLLIPPACQCTWPEDRPLRILVTLDGSALSQEALEPAGGVAKVLGGMLLLVEVVEPPGTVDSFVLCGSWERYLYSRTDLTAEAAMVQQRLEGLAAPLRARGLPVHTHAVIGLAGTTIVELVREFDVDLVVLTTHGQSGYAPTVMGRIATGVLRRSTVPLLFVRPAGLRHAPMRPSLQPWRADNRRLATSKQHVEPGQSHLNFLERGGWRGDTWGRAPLQRRTRRKRM
ncbi:MAG: universal stress protein, partial [Chloroflexi bacterium]|nr:universal stress protein [Chloroflexota bacterium]